MALAANRRRLKILHVISTLDPKTGGPAERVRQLASVNTVNGHTVSVLTLDKPEAPWLHDFEFQYFALGPARLKYSYNHRLVKWLRANHTQFDAIVVNGIWQYPSFATWRALHGTQTPYFVFAHGMLDPWFKRRFPLKHLKKWMYWPWGEYRVLRDAAAVFFTCEEERRLASQSFWLYRCRERVLSFGVATPPQDDGGQVEAFLSRFPDLRGKKLLLSLGRIHQKKGVDLTIRAFANLIERLEASASRTYHLVIAGPEDITYANSLRALISELNIQSYVTWTGMLSGDAKWGAFRASNAFILSSYQENFGIAVAEALACALPVLISKGVNIWREIEEDGAGFVEPSTLEGTTNLVNRWADCSDEEWVKVRVAAAASFTNRFEGGRAATSLVDAIARHKNSVEERRKDTPLKVAA